MPKLHRYCLSGERNADCAGRGIICRFVIAAWLLFLAAGQARAADLVVIVSARSSVTALSAGQVADIFLAEVATFPDGRMASPVDQRVGSLQRDEFYAKVARRSPAMMKAYWARMVFTGRGQPPRELSGNAAVRRQVAADPALIGYIERRALDASVRVVGIVH